MSTDVHEVLREMLVANGCGLGYAQAVAEGRENEESDDE